MTMLVITAVMYIRVNTQTETRTILVTTVARK